MPEPNTGCWLWLGLIREGPRYGYGDMKMPTGKRGGKARRAHRVSYEAFKGPIPEGMIVRHKCDVRCCVNPDHLVLGTHADNDADARARGRKQYRGAGNPNGKLSDADIVAIVTDPRSAREVARAWCVHESYVHTLRRGEKRAANLEATKERMKHV